MHDADADYTAQNLPDEAELDAMMESALALAAVLQGGRRGVDHEGRGRSRFSPPANDVVARDDAFSRQARFAQVMAAIDPVVEVPPPAPRHDPKAFDSALRAAFAEPGTVTGDDAKALERARETMSKWVESLRERRIDDPVVGHALNSIDLGLVGLARAVGDGGSDR